MPLIERPDGTFFKICLDQVESFKGTGAKVVEKNGNGAVANNKPLTTASKSMPSRRMAFVTNN